MVEEAAGTRMYEGKKQAAYKTIEKKDAKLHELDEVSLRPCLIYAIFGGTLAVILLTRIWNV